MPDKNKSPDIHYLIDGIQYDVVREFTGKVPLQELLRQEVTAAVKYTTSIDQAANL